MTVLKWCAATALAYAALVAVMYLAQRSLMYLPETARTTPAKASLAAEEIALATADGETLVAWHAAPAPGKPIVIYFQGNGGSLRYRAARFASLLAGDYGLLAVSYRGYGGSTGSPSEAGLIEDARTAYAYAAARHPAREIALWGESLGTGVAVALAAERPVGHVVLESPFTSALAVAESVYWYLPVRWLMKDPFRSDQRIATVTAPVLVLHGGRDRTVPIAMARRLFAMIRAPKRFVELPEADHEDHDRFGAVEIVKRFLAGEDSVSSVVGVGSRQEAHRGKMHEPRF